MFKIDERIRDIIKDIIKLELQFIELKRIDKEVAKYNKLKCKLANQQDIVHALMRQYRNKFEDKEKEI